MDYKKGVFNMKYLYIYNNNSRNTTEGKMVEHSTEISKKTINKEKEDNNFLHIFKKYTRNGEDFYKYTTSYCIN